MRKPGYAFLASHSSAGAREQSSSAAASGEDRCAEPGLRASGRDGRVWVQSSQRCFLIAVRPRASHSMSPHNVFIVKGEKSTFTRAGVTHVRYVCI